MVKIKKLKSIANLGWHLIKSLPRQKYFQKSDSNYFILTAHPDDEILISGLLQRLTQTGSEHTFLSLSNGSVNHSGDERIQELSDALKFIGYEKHLQENQPLNVVDEKEIYNAIRGDSDLGDLVSDIIHAVKERIKISQPDRILVPDYSGAHFVHDLTQLIGVIAARQYQKESGNRVQVYEFPQCVLLGAEKYSSKELTNEITRLRKSDKHQKKTKPLNIKIKVGEFDPSKKRLSGFHDSNLAIFNGQLRLSAKEFRKKVRHYTAFYQSQEESLNQYEKVHSLGNVSREEFRLVPPTRDYNQRPSLNPLFYEICAWRKFNFNDFQRVVKEAGYRPPVIKFPILPITPTADLLTP